MNPSGGHELTREELYERVWSTPVTQVAAELGISSLALARRCKKLNVPKPPSGYWLKITVGQESKKVPLPPMPPSAGEIFAQEAEKPLPKTLSLPETTAQLHPMAAELLRVLKVTKLSYDQRVWGGDIFLPLAKVGRDATELTAKCFHVIVTNVESVGIPFHQPQGGRNTGFFRKGNDRLYLEIEDEVETSTGTVRRPNWQFYGDSRVLSGRLIFSLSDNRYSSSKIKQWKDDRKVSLETLLAEIVAEIRKYFVAAVRRREQEAVKRKKKAIEREQRRVEYEKEEVVRREKEREQKHANVMDEVAKDRANDLFKAVEWWRLHQLTVEFINECERRWRGNPVVELTAEKQAWLIWARENAKAMSPLETGYPDPAKDGAFNPANIPFGGPYPTRRDFPPPPTMPKIPPPVQQNGYSSVFGPEPKQQYLFGENIGEDES